MDGLRAATRAGARRNSETPTDRHVDQRYRVYLEISKLCGLRFFTIPLELKIWGTTEEFVASCRVLPVNRVQVTPRVLLLSPGSYVIATAIRRELVVAVAVIEVNASKMTSQI